MTDAVFGKVFRGVFGRPASLVYDQELDEDDHVMTVEEYMANVDAGGFIDYDGSGYPVRDGKHCNVVVSPSLGRQCIPDDATHIVWYNK